MKLRIATPEDAAIIHDIYDHYIENSVATYNEQNKSVMQRAEEIAALLNDYPFFVAEDESGAFLGFANAEPVRPQSGYRYCAELTIYLHPSAPKHAGIGKALYTVLLDSLKKQGFRVAYAVIDSGNEGSLALHKAFGFAQEAIFRSCGYKHGRWLDTVWLRKELNAFDESPAPIIPFCEYRKELNLD